MKGTAKDTEILIDERGYDPELEAMIGDVRNQPWSKKDEETLGRYYGKVKTRALVTKLGRSHASITSKVRELGLQFEAKTKGKSR